MKMKLIKLADHLDKIGLIREASYLDDLIIKIALDKNLINKIIGLLLSDNEDNVHQGFSLIGALSDEYKDFLDIKEGLIEALMPDIARELTAKAITKYDKTDSFADDIVFLKILHEYDFAEGQFWLQQIKADFGSLVLFIKSEIEKVDLPNNLNISVISDDILNYVKETIGSIQYVVTDLEVITPWHKTCEEDSDGNYIISDEYEAKHQDAEERDDTEIIEWNDLKNIQDLESHLKQPNYNYSIITAGPDIYTMESDNTNLEENHHRGENCDEDEELSEDPFFWEYSYSMSIEKQFNRDGVIVSMNLNPLEINLLSDIYP